MYCRNSSRRLPEALSRRASHEKRGAERKDAPRQRGDSRGLRDLGQVQDVPYRFRAGAIYNLNADRFIADHSDICGHEVAAAGLATVAST